MTSAISHPAADLIANVARAIAAAARPGRTGRSLLVGKGTC